MSNAFIYALFESHGFFRHQGNRRMLHAGQDVITQTVADIQSVSGGRKNCCGFYLTIASKT